MMRTLHKLLLINAVAHLVENALGNDIVHGEEVPEGSMPYMASVQDQSGRHVCGGFLISQDLVVTAAHCFPDEPVRVVVGAHDLKSKNKIIESIFRKCRHTCYVDPGDGHDLMLLQLSKKVELGANIQLVTLAQPGTNVMDGQSCEVAGWGKTSSNGGMVDKLRRTNVSVINRQQCKARWPCLPRDAICAGGSNTTHGFCQGDSGGPLMCNGICVGVVSHNHAKVCSYPEEPNVYVNIAAYRGWIDNALRRNFTCKE